MLPNFLIIGAPRSGTDFLFYSLASHPRIFIAKNREVHYFDRNYDKGLSWYENYFSHCDPDQLIGEKTANYFVTPECASRIKRTLDNVKLIVILRNPIERAYSHYRNWVGSGKIDLQTSFRQCIKLYPEILVIGNYYDHLKRYLEYFESEEILVIFFDDLVNFPHQEYKKILSFLDINDDYHLPEVKKYNVSKKVYRLGGYVLSQRDLKLIEKLLPKVLISRLLNLIEYRFGPISQEDKKFLKEHYQDLNEKLFDLLNIRKDWND